MRLFGQILLFIVLTIITQIGGVAWLLSRYLPLPALVSFLFVYGGMSYVTTKIAPVFDRQPLPCFGERLVSRSLITCVLNRNYVNRELYQLLTNYSNDLSEAYVPSRTYTLDASFPFGSAPLLPDPRKRDGRQVDLALYYEQAGLTRFETRSPIGYFAYEYPAYEICDKMEPTMRWGMRWLQPYLQSMPLDEARMRYMLDWLATHKSDYGIKTVGLEPHLARRYGNGDLIFQFQGCHVPRHDDHIHIEIE